MNLIYFFRKIILKKGNIRSPKNIIDAYNKKYHIHLFCYKITFVKYKNIENYNFFDNFDNLYENKLNIHANYCI